MQRATPEPCGFRQRGGDPGGGSSWLNDHTPLEAAKPIPTIRSPTKKKCKFLQKPSMFSIVYQMLCVIYKDTYYSIRLN